MSEPKITLCPPGPEPVRYTASCKEMGVLLQNSPNADLTIDERREVWWAQHRQPRSVTIEEWLLHRFGGEKE